MSQRRWVVMALVFVGILVSYVDRGNLSVASVSIMNDLRLNPASMGMLLSAFFWTYGLCQLPAGLVVDRFGVRGVYAMAFLVWSLASASMSLSRGPGDILASRLVLGLAESIGPIASLAFIRANFPPRENGVPTSIYIAGQNLGPAVGLLLGTTLLVDFGWRIMFAVTGLGALFWIPAWLGLAPKFTPKTAGEKTIAAATPWNWGALAADPGVWAMSACVFFFSYYWYFVLTWVPAYLTMARGFSTKGMGQILAAPMVCMVVGNLVTGRLADKLIKKSHSLFSVRVRFAAVGLVGASSLLLLNNLQERWEVLPVLFVSVCSYGMVSANYWTIAQNVAPPARVGRAIGYLNTLSQSAGAAAPYVTGLLLGPEKHFRVAITIAGLCPLVALVLLLVAGRRLDNIRLLLDSPAR